MKNRYLENEKIAEDFIEKECGNKDEFRHRVEVFLEIADHCGYNLEDKHDLENCNNLFESIANVINKHNPYTF